MNLKEVVFAFFVVLAATLNFGFFIGEIDRPDHHNISGLLLAVLVNLFATGLKWHDRTHMGAIHLATSLVADLQLIAACVTWVTAVYITGEGMTPATTVRIVSMSGAALVASMMSVTMLVVDTFRMRQ